MIEESLADECARKMARIAVLEARLKEAEELLRRYRNKGKGQTHGCLRLFPECDECRETETFLRGAK